MRAPIFTDDTDELLEAIGFDRDDVAAMVDICATAHDLGASDEEIEKIIRQWLAAERAKRKRSVH